MNNNPYKNNGRKPKKSIKGLRRETLLTSLGHGYFLEQRTAPFGKYHRYTLLCANGKRIDRGIAIRHNALKTARALAEKLWAERLNRERHIEMGLKENYPEVRVPPASAYRFLRAIGAGDEVHGLELLIEHYIDCYQGVEPAPYVRPESEAIPIQVEEPVALESQSEPEPESPKPHSPEVSVSEIKRDPKAKLGTRGNPLIIPM